MTLTKPSHLSCALALSLFASFAANTAFAGEPCEDNFSVSGNFVTGKTYRTSAIIPNAQARDAFDGAMSFTVGNGFTVQSSDKNAGTISAIQTSNKRVPLSILISPDGVNTKMAFSYLTPTGVHSPEDAIKKHFCSTVVAATNTARVAAAAPIAAAVSSPAPQQPQQNTPTPRPIQRGAPVGYAVITAEQREAIQATLTKSIPNDRIREMIKEAMPVISIMAERQSCLSSYLGSSALNEYAAPGHKVSNFGIVMSNMSYHDKSICLTVLRISGWNAPANNALRYEVMYKAEDSGETAITKHELVRQTDGNWLFTERY